MEKLPSDYEEVKQKGIHVFIKGNLIGADLLEKVKYLILYFFALVLLPIALIDGIIFFLSGNQISTMWTFILISLFATITIIFYYYWGWKKTFEAWYYFDHENEIMFALIKSKSPILLEIPYEEIETIDWSGGSNGFAIIRTPIVSLKTERAKNKREGSITEMWSEIAKTRAPFQDWPYTLLCVSCNEEFGHHIGTAVCPFEENIALIDPNAKGRHDPESISHEDLDRV